MSEIKVMKNSKQEPSKGAEEIPHWPDVFRLNEDKPSKGAEEIIKPFLIKGDEIDNEGMNTIYFISKGRCLEAMEQYRSEGLKEELIKFMIWYNRHFDVADIQRESEKIVNDYLSNNQKP
jgi:hypothetical protein